MDTVYGTKKYFQSLGAAENDYYNRHSASTNRVMAACSSYQNTLGRHSTIGPYSHLSTKYPYPTTTTGVGNDFSHTSQYGYNSWGMWRDSRNLTPSSTYSSKGRSSIKSFTIILMTAAFIVVVAVLSVAALAFYFSTFKSDDSIMIFDGKFQVSRGDVFTTGLKYNHTTAFQQKAEFYRNLIAESLDHNGLSVYKCEVNGFGSGPLIQVDFRVFLDMRRVPMTIRSVEDHIKDSLLKEIMSSKSTRGIQIDLPTLEIKRLLDADILKSASFVREPVTTPSSMHFDEKSRKVPSTLISKPHPKLTTSKPKQKPDIVEPEIDIENVPILQGSFEVTKTDADITQKKVRTSTLRPFTITNGSVRMKPKKTTIEKVKPLPKIPENLTANILKLENVTKPNYFERTTTSRPTTTTEEIPMTMSTEAEIQSSSTKMTSTPTPTSTTTMTAKISTKVITETTSTTEAFIASIVVPSAPPPTESNDRIVQLEGETMARNSTIQKTIPSDPILDDQPWLPIHPNVDHLNYTLNDAKITNHNPVSPPAINPGLNQGFIGFQLLPRNKLRDPMIPMQKTKRPTLYQSYTNPALMYATHEVERLGGFVKPYPIPIDLISDEVNHKKVEDLVLNKGEVLASEYFNKLSEQPSSSVEFTSSATATVTQSTVSTSEAQNEKLDDKNNDANEETQDSLEFSANSTNVSSDEAGTKIGEILLDLLNDGGVRINETKSDELILESRVDEDLDLPEPKPDEMLSRMDEIEMPEENDHTEAFDALATAISTMETLSFKNIKDYIMATTKSFGKETITTATERDVTTPGRENPQNLVDTIIKSDRISLLAPTTSVSIKTPLNIDNLASSSSLSSTTSSLPSTTAQFSIEADNTEPITASYVEVETVQYTPGTSWDQPALFPVQSKWEYVNGSLVYPNRAPMRKVFNETLQAWIIENPIETKERVPPINFVRNNSEPLKNISAIFDTLASKLGIGPNVSTKLPPFMSHFASNKQKITDVQTLSTSELFASPTLLKRPVHPTNPTPPASSSIAATEDELPILLNQQTESYYGSSAETLLGQAEVEEVDPTQYEQMLLIDRKSAEVHPTSTAPSLITLMPVKSNSGLRRGSVVSEKLDGNARGFPPSAATSSLTSSSNKSRVEDTSFVVRTNINVSS